MDFANRGNRPNTTQQTQPSAQNEQPSSFQPPVKKSSRMDFGKLSSVFMLVTVSLLAFALILGLVFMQDGSNEEDVILTNNYQAVFLDSQDGQVYFGKLDVYNKDMYRLTDIYYVRVENPIQPEGANQAAQPNISLAKLGNELHGPQDVMFISRDRVLYWENLKDDGQVVTAITEFKKNGEQTPAANDGQAADQSQAAPSAPTETQPVGTDQRNDTSAPTTVPDPNLVP